MNKKITSEITIGLLLFLALTIGGIFWMQDNKQNTINAPEVKQLQKVGTTSQSQEERNASFQSVNSPVEVANDVCKKYSSALSKIGAVKFETIDAQGVVFKSGNLCSVKVTKMTYSPNKENEVDKIEAILIEDGWKEDNGMKRDTGAVGSYTSTTGYKKGDSVLVFEISVSSPQVQVDKCMTIEDSNLSSTCFSKILKTEKLTIMAGNLQNK